MKNFIKGAVFIAAVLPVIEGLLGLFNQGLEWICTKIAVGTYNLKKDLEEPSTESTPVIGFTVPSLDEEQEN